MLLIYLDSKKNEITTFFYMPQIQGEEEFRY
jgi:predicted adenine nucleotide alpha hydrolase (AANH) superfamily ATPase